MTNSNKKKSKVLGMTYGCAVHQLRKSIIFHLAKRLGMLKCHQCGKEIETLRDLSVEHKVPWQGSSNPREVFFDINNIAFSHLGCNSGARVAPNKISAPEGTHWCRSCKQYMDKSMFYQSSLATNRGGRCKECEKTRRRRQRAR